MSYIISKELLSEVENVGAEVYYVEQLGNLILYKWVLSVNGEIQNDKINIHELANKCKEWAYKYGQEMASYRVQDTETPYYRCITATTSLNLNRDLRHGFFAESEPEAIFCACQWILENK